MTLNLPQGRIASNKYVNILDASLRSPTSPAQSDDQSLLQTSRRLPNAPFSTENFFLKTDHSPIDETKTFTDIFTSKYFYSTVLFILWIFLVLRNRKKTGLCLFIHFIFE